MFARGLGHSSRAIALSGLSCAIAGHALDLESRRSSSGHNGGAAACDGCPMKKDEAAAPSAPSVGGCPVKHDAGGSGSPSSSAGGGGGGCPVKHDAGGAGGGSSGGGMLSALSAYRNPKQYNVYAEPVAPAPTLDPRNNMPTNANQTPAPGQVGASYVARRRRSGSGRL